jgi:D-alanyl-D-alanine carboxypeptidase/D-alanyl-D-alanine-endopeptidase (penicillin-binding protein 4)
MYEAMKKRACSFAAALLCLAVHAQDISTRLQTAYTRFEADSQLRNSLSSLYVIDAKTGAVVFAKNETIGLAPASTLKIVTAATSYEILGKNFQYTTDFGYSGQIANNVLNGWLQIQPSGDPTLGSWRWSTTKDNAVLSRVLRSIRQLGINRYDSILVDESGWEGTTIPDGWIWQDIGNYYGAGAQAFNWHENQYDLVLHSGIIRGTPVSVVETTPHLYFMDFRSFVTAAPKGTGDQTYIYLPIGSSHAEVRGTIPVGEEYFTVSGALPSGRDQFIATLMDSLAAMGIRKNTGAHDSVFLSKKVPANVQVFHHEQSPVLDSMVYWFLKKSINLYGEVLLKTLAWKQEAAGTTQKGVELVRNFWRDKGIAPTELNIVDGSGLSPSDRITTHAQVTVLRYAQKQPWFAGYYAAFPEYNGMKMKSGSIGGVRSFCGYQRSRDGHDYIFSFLVNNYNGPSAGLVSKMYEVLNELK